MDESDFLDADELAALRGASTTSTIDPDLLEYKEACDGCAVHISWIDPAYICSHECTWCPECADGHGMVCPNCSGELGKRPRRTQPVGRK